MVLRCRMFTPTAFVRSQQIYATLIAEALRSCGRARWLLRKSTLLNGRQPSINTYRADAAPRDILAELPGHRAGSSDESPAQRMAIFRASRTWAMR